MPFTYQHCTGLFKKRKKGADFRAVLRHCHMLRDGDDFLIKMYRWNHQAGKNELVPLARVSPNNVVTLLYEGTLDMTVCNRLYSVGGLAVGLNKRQFSAYRQHVRVYKYHTWAESMPYFAGMQIDVSAPSPRVINPQPDVRTIVDPSMVTKAKNEFAQLRKLAKVMMRMNAFDDLYASNYTMLNYDKIKDAKPLSEVNAEEPTMDDVLAIVAAGNNVAVGPKSYVYDPVARKYNHLSREALQRGYIESCIEHGLRLLRRQFYEKSDAYVEREQLAA